MRGLILLSVLLLIVKHTVSQEMMFSSFCSCLWRTPDKAKWNYNHTRVAKRISSKQKLCVAGGCPDAIPNFDEV